MEGRKEGRKEARKEPPLNHHFFDHHHPLLCLTLRKCCACHEMKKLFNP